MITLLEKKGKMLNFLYVFFSFYEHNLTFARYFFYNPKSNQS
jgi:hypothetical protein